MPANADALLEMISALRLYDAVSAANDGKQPISGTYLITMVVEDQLIERVEIESS